MKKLFYCVSVLLFLVISTEAILAAESTPSKNAVPENEKKAAEKKPKTTTATKPQTLTGEITALDVMGGTVSVKGASEEKSFTTQDAAKDSLEIVKIGERVRMTYSEKDGKLVATSMKRMKPKTATSGAKEKKPAKSQTPSTKDGGESKKP